MPDVQTQVGALQNGEIDMIESPGHDLLPLLRQGQEHQAGRTPIRSATSTSSASTSTAKPFDNAKIRHAVFVAFAQEDFLKATIGDPQWYKVCKAVVRLRHAAGQRRSGMADVLNGNAAKAKQLLKEAGYDGTPVVLHAVDRPAGADQPGARSPRSSSRRAGFKVDMQSMDWQTLVGRRVKKDPPDKGGWNAFLTSWVAADILNPVMAGFFNAVVRQGDVRLAVRRDRSRSCATSSPRRPIRPSRSRSSSDLQKYWVEHPTHVNRRPVVCSRSPCATPSTATMIGAGAGVLERDQEVA